MFIDFFLKSKISEELFGTLMLISFLSSCFFCFSIPLLVTIFSKKDDNFIKKSAFGHKLGKNKIFIFDYTSYNELIDYVENSKKASLYSINATAEYGDQLLTLSTCSYHTEDRKTGGSSEKDH